MGKALLERNPRISIYDLPPTILKSIFRYLLWMGEQDLATIPNTTIITETTRTVHILPRRYLSCCLLVCKLWHQLTCQVLYHEITLSTSSDALNLVKLISNPFSPLKIIMKLHLHSLTFTPNCLQEMELGDMEYILSYFPYLKQLRIGRWTSASNMLLILIARLVPNIKYIEIQDCCHLTDATVDLFSSACKNLESLNFSKTFMTISSLFILLENCKMIKCIEFKNHWTTSNNLSNNILYRSINGFDRDFNTNIENHTKHIIEAERSSIENGYNNTMSFINVPWSATLRYLDLSGTLIQDNHLVAILKQSPGLRYLTLKNCQNITDASIVTISKFYSKLQILDLEGCSGLTPVSVFAMMFSTTWNQHCRLILDPSLWKGIENAIFGGSYDPAKVLQDSSNLVPQKMYITRSTMTEKNFFDELPPSLSSSSLVSSSLSTETLSGNSTPFHSSFNEEKFRAGLNSLKLDTTIALPSYHYDESERSFATSNSLTIFPEDSGSPYLHPPRFNSSSTNNIFTAIAASRTNRQANRVSWPIMRYDQTMPPLPKIPEYENLSSSGFPVKRFQSKIPVIRQLRQPSTIGIMNSTSSHSDLSSITPKSENRYMMNNDNLVSNSTHSVPNKLQTPKSVKSHISPHNTNNTNYKIDKTNSTNIPEKPKSSSIPKLSSNSSTINFYIKSKYPTSSQYKNVSSKINTNLKKPSSNKNNDSVMHNEYRPRAFRKINSYGY